MKDPELYWLATAIRDCNLTERWASLWISEENELKAMTQLEILLSALTRTMRKLYAC